MLSQPADGGGLCNLSVSSLLSGSRQGNPQHGRCLHQRAWMKSAFPINHLGLVRKKERCGCFWEMAKNLWVCLVVSLSALLEHACGTGPLGGRWLKLKMSSGQQDGAPTASPRLRVDFKGCYCQGKHRDAGQWPFSPIFICNIIWEPPFFRFFPAKLCKFRLFVTLRVTKFC